VQNIKWLDGQNAFGKYVLEILYDNGSSGYMKNDSYEQICHYYRLALELPEVLSVTIYNPQWKVVCTTARAAA